jgi:glycosyltransferase involved in cell wall biosynthesis
MNSKLIKASQPLKVAHVVISLDCGGLEELVVRWTKLRNQKHPGSTLIICLDKIGELGSKAHGENTLCLDAQRDKFPWDSAATRRLQQTIETHRIDILHSHNMTAQQYVAVANFKKGRKHVYTQHGANTHLSAFHNRIRSRVLCFMTDAIVAVSENTAKSMHQNQWIPNHDIVRIDNGVEIPPENELYGSNMPTTVPWGDIPKDRFIMGSVGRLSFVKGWDRFLPEFARCIQNWKEKHKPVLLLVGEGDQRQKLQSQAERLGLVDDVIFTGYQTDPFEMIKLMDAFILPSRSEGMSMALLESMACARPAIVTDVGDSGRLIRESQGGWILSEDSSQWAGQISSIARQSSVLQEKGMKARDYVKRHFSITKCLDEYEQLYGRLCLAHSS